jgi:uncharacterized protein
MLKSNMLRLRFLLDGGIRPNLVAENSQAVRKRIAEVLEIIHSMLGKSRGEVDDALNSFVKAGGDLRINRGLVEVAQGYAQFETAEPGRAQVVRRLLFERGAEGFPLGLVEGGASRNEALARVAADVGTSVPEIERLMFSDLKEAQRLLEFAPPDVEGFLRRYNVALAQGILIHALDMEVALPGAEPRRLRQLIRYLKFFRLLFAVDFKSHGVHIRIDGPLSVIKQTKAYGVRLASFLPALLLLDDFVMTAQVRWKRRRYTTSLSPADGLVSHYRDSGAWLPEEMAHFINRLREIAPPGWRVTEASSLHSLGGRAVYVPDLRIETPRGDALLEIIWPWKVVRWKQYYQLFRKHAPRNAFLCVSTKSVEESFRVGNSDARLVYYRATPLADRTIKAIEKALDKH